MDNDWQSNIFGSRDRAGILLKNNILTDVQFAFSKKGAKGAPKTLHAHKLFLASASPVFHKMFYGNLAEDTNNKAIAIENIEWETFAILLKYIYTDEIELDSWESAISVYEAGKKYLINALAKYCIEIVKEHLEARNSLLIYKYAEFHEEDDLKKAALKVIREESLLVFKSPDFLKIDIGTMVTILEQDKLQTTEFELFNALESLAVAQGVIGKISHINTTTEETFLLDCDKNSSQVACLLSTFRKVIKKINFLEMTAEQFSSGAVFSKLLFSEDSAAILACLIQPSNIKTYYPKDFAQNVRQKNLPRVFFDINDADGDLYIGRIVIELRSDVVPETIETFLALCTDKKTIGFKGAAFDNIKTTHVRLSACALDFSSGKKVTQSRTPENFTLKHTGVGTVGLLKKNKKSCVNCFYITHSPLANFDLQNVVIGKVIEGMNVVKTISSFATEPEIPSKIFRIENCGEICRNVKSET